MCVADLLSGIPDTNYCPVVETWANANLHRLHNLQADNKLRVSFAAMEGSQLLGDQQTEMLRFANAALLADWSCYSAPSNRADISRLHAVISAFPSGFRVWFCQDADTAVPVGYTGWYPISAEAFDKAHDCPHALTHRRELWPEPRIPEQGGYIWLFNYSIIGSLRQSAESRRLLGRYAEDLSRVTKKGLAAAVLSEESKRVAARFGMTFRGKMAHDGVSEDVYAVRL